MGTRKGRSYGKGAPFKGAPQRFRLPQTAPPLDHPPLVHTAQKNAFSLFAIKPFQQ